MALTPALATVSGSGKFTGNAMYVTRRVTSVGIAGDGLLRQSPTVTPVEAVHQIRQGVHRGGGV